MDTDYASRSKAWRMSLAYSLIYGVRCAETRILYEMPRPSADVIAWRDEAIKYIAESVAGYHPFEDSDVKAMLNRAPVDVRRKD